MSPMKQPHSYIVADGSTEFEPSRLWAQTVLLLSLLVIPSAACSHLLQGLLGLVCNMYHSKYQILQQTCTQNTSLLVQKAHEK